jgi:hypothetical protein
MANLPIVLKKVYNLFLASRLDLYQKFSWSITYPFLPGNTAGADLVRIKPCDFIFSRCTRRRCQHVQSISSSQLYMGYDLYAATHPVAPIAGSPFDSPVATILQM